MRCRPKKRKRGGAKGSAQPSDVMKHKREMKKNGTESISVKFRNVWQNFSTGWLNTLIRQCLSIMMCFFSLFSLLTIVICYAHSLCACVCAIFVVFCFYVVVLSVVGNSILTNLLVGARSSQTDIDIEISENSGTNWFLR